MSAQQALMVSIITEGTDLGQESAGSEDAGAFNAGASAQITFQTNGAITFSQTGDTQSNTAPATNWNTNGGTHISYEVIELSTSGDGYAEFVYANNQPFSSSTMHGENRASMSQALVLSASGIGTLNEQTFGSGLISVKISVWDSATNGSRKAYGQYTVSADATVA